MGSKCQNVGLCVGSNINCQSFNDDLIFLIVYSKIKNNPLFVSHFSLTFVIIYMMFVWNRLPDINLLTVVD